MKPGYRLTIPFAAVFAGLALVAIAFTALAYVHAQTAADADFDGDGTVGFSDFVAFAGNFGTSRGDGRYDARYDLNGDGNVGFADFVVFAGFFGQSSVPNDAPVLERIGDQGVPVGVPLKLELAASDPDGDDLRFRVSGQPPGASFSGTTFQWTPTGGIGDVHTVTFTVDDGRGGTDSETISVRVVDFRFKFVGHRISTEAPSFVNILFQVLDLDNWGVTALTSEHFEVREDDQVVSPSESAMRVQKRKALPHRFKLKTVLMLDTSTSVRDQLEQIKEAAIVLVENMTENQEIALYEFSEDPVLLQDFTNDVEALTKAIREIRLGFSTTNLYGSIITGTGRWRDVFSTTEVEQGFLVILTDGSDTQGSSTLAEALDARGKKNVYTIGLGNEIDPEVLKELGNAGFFQISDVTELADQLADRFIEIQKRIVSFADSFYWLRYLSPKRGDRDHRLELRVIGNLYNFVLWGEFNSRDFHSVRPEVYINRSSSNPEGIRVLGITAGDSVRLRVETYPELRSPRYSWRSSDSDIVAIKADPADASVAWAIAFGDSARVTLMVFDEANELERQVEAVVLPPTLIVTLPGGSAIEMVAIPQGMFHMGAHPSDAHRRHEETPLHEVTFSQGFYLGKYEVTNAQWETVMGFPSGPSSSWQECEECPVLVRWSSAQRFIKKLNEIEGADRLRLPSEAEWEYAARAGTTTAYSWGNEIGTNRANCNGCGSQWDGQPAPVGSFAPNAWGLHDTHGNSDEWVQDCFNISYEGAPADGSAWESGDCSYRVIRGGDWRSSPSRIRAASRARYFPEIGYAGLRIAWELSN